MFTRELVPEAYELGHPDPDRTCSDCGTRWWSGWCRDNDAISPEDCPICTGAADE